MIEALGQIAFRATKGGQTQAQRRFRQRKARAQARQDLLLDHHFKFRRDARGEEHQAAVQLNGKPAGGADRVINQFRAGGNFSLLAVAGGHHAATPGEKALHLCQPRLVQNQAFAFGRGGGQRAEIVAGGSQPAVHNQHVAAFAALAKNVDQRLKIVTYGVAAR